VEPAVPEIGELRASDVPTLADLHLRAFPGFFLSSLGESFLRQFYRGFIGDPAAVAVVARNSAGRPVGAAVGSTEPAGFFRRLLRRQLWGFLGAALRAITTDPGTAPRLIRALWYRGDSNAPGIEGALLSSICVDPRVQGSGVGNDLLHAWVGAAAEKGARSAYLFTDAADNDGVNHFYLAHGWRAVGMKTTRQQRTLNIYVCELRPRA
jgi:ribosomal protein S18 acetylase RimI-like enzyme